MDGLWQSERYFKDVEPTIRNDLKIIAPQDAQNSQVAEKIRCCNSAVALHVRWFDSPGGSSLHNISTDYYQHALAIMEERIVSPHYFLFSDNVEAARSRLPSLQGRVTMISHNRGDEQAFADLWLMSQCRHFIIANSTFSWWGAWLGESEESIILVPDFIPEGYKTSWGFQGLIPDRWELVPV